MAERFRDPLQRNIEEYEENLKMSPDSLSTALQFYEDTEHELEKGKVSIHSTYHEDTNEFRITVIDKENNANDRYLIQVTFNAKVFKVWMFSDLENSQVSEEYFNTPEDTANFLNELGLSEFISLEDLQIQEKLGMKKASPANYFSGSTRMRKYANIPTWVDIINQIQYPRSIEEIHQVVESSGMTFEEFKSECEAFYKLYLNMLDYMKGTGFSKNMTKMFNTVARILDLIGHEPELATEEDQKVLLDFLSEETPEQVYSSMKQIYKKFSVSRIKNTFDYGPYTLSIETVTGEPITVIVKDVEVLYDTPSEASEGGYFLDYSLYNEDETPFDIDELIRKGIIADEDGEVYESVDIPNLEEALVYKGSVENHQSLIDRYSSVKKGDHLSENDVPEHELEKGIKIESEHKDTIQDLYSRLKGEQPSKTELTDAFTNISLDHEKETMAATGKPEYYEKYLIPMEKEMKEEGKISNAKQNEKKSNVKLNLHTVKNLDEFLKLAEQEGLIKTSADIMPSVGNMQPGQIMINPQTKEMYTVKDIINQQGKEVVETQGNQDSTNVSYFDKDTFDKTMQPIQGLQNTIASQNVLRTKIAVETIPVNSIDWSAVEQFLPKTMEFLDLEEDIQETIISEGGTLLYIVDEKRGYPNGLYEAEDQLIFTDEENGQIHYGPISELNNILNLLYADLLATTKLHSTNATLKQ